MARTVDILAGARKLLFGVAVAQAIGVISLPILTRIYSPHDFAVLALFVSVISILNPVISLRYAAGIPLPNTNIFAINLAAASMTLLLGSVAFLVIFTTLLDTWLLSFRALKLLDGYIWLVPVGLLFTNLYELVSFWSMRHKAFGALARSKASQSVIGNLTKILLGLLGLHPFGLLVGQVVSQSAGIVVQIQHAFPNFQTLLNKITLRRMLKSLKQFWRFPAFQVPSQLFSISAEQVPVIFVAASYESEQIGNFGLALALIYLPVTLLGKTLSNSFYAVIAEVGRHRAREVWDISTDIIKRTLMVAIPIGVVIFLFAEQFLPLILGAQWVLAGTVVAWMAPYLVGHIAFAIISRTLDVFHRQDLKLRLSLQRLVLVAVLLIWVSQTDMGFTDFVRVYSILIFLHFTFSTGWVLFFLRQMQKEASTAFP